MMSLFANGGCPCCLAWGTLAEAKTYKRQGFFADAPIARATAWQNTASRQARHAAPGTLRLDGGTIVNPRDGSLRQGTSIYIEDGRITGIQDAISGDEPGVKTIDITGKFVVPGYNDMHCHALELENPSGTLALMLADGVTGFRQMSGSPELLGKRNDASLPLIKEGPDALEMPGTVLFPFSAPTEEAIRGQIKLQKSLGADFLKMAMIAPSLFQVTMGMAQASNLPVLGHVPRGVPMQEAVAAGFKSIEHLGPGDVIWIASSTQEDELLADAASQPIPKPPPMKNPIVRWMVRRMMPRFLVNPYAYSPPEDAARLQRAFDSFSEPKLHALLARFAAAGTWHVPTLVRIKAMEMPALAEYENDPYLRYMPQEAIKRWRKVKKKFMRLPEAARSTYASAYARQLQLTKALADAGVKMMSGSDGGSMLSPGLTLQQEFAELGKAGLLPLKILQMATVNAAEYLGRAAMMGQVAVGYNADLVLLDADPLEEVKNLGAIAGVVRAGYYYSTADLAVLKDRVARGQGYLNP